ncbi:Putative ABC-type transport system involved in lysophospholipase L1 biosynthesis, permease component [Ruminococcaceae bacterium BL-4]|nr:Putative ABC-type transport system involved in lysophospholipase L1 biosynthesis, permease component [Ruminococcaceae bacterium BL-4]
MSWKNILLRKDWIHNRTRNILSSLSILLGVAVIIATAITIASSKSAFLQMLGAQNSGADLLAVSVPEEKISTAEFDYRDATIEDAFPFFSKDVYFENQGTYHSLTEMAVDFGKESACGGVALSSGRLPGKDECLVSETVKTAYGLNQGDTLTIRTESGSEKLVISGFVSNTGIATENLGKCLLTDYRNMPGLETITYKLKLKPGTDVKAEKAAIEHVVAGKYTLSYPGSKSEELTNEVNLLFGTMMGFGFLTLLLGGFLVNVTVNEYVRKMRQKLAALKVLGAVKSDIVRLVLKKSLIIGLTGALCGAVAGIGGSFGLIALVGRSLCGGMAILPVFNWDIPVGVVLGTVLFCLLVTLPAASHAAKENIIEGFHQNDGAKGISTAGMAVSGVLSVFMIAARIFTGQWLFTFAAIATSLYFVATIGLIPCARLVLRPINHFSPFNGFAVKNNFIRQKRRAVNLAVLFTFVIAIFVGITLVVSEISDSINRMEKGEYFGDAVVSTVTGQCLSADALARVCVADGVDRAYPVYQKYATIGENSVQMKGFALDVTNETRLRDYWGIDEASLRALGDPDTILLSQKVLSNQKLKVGDTVALGSGAETVTLKIIGSYTTMNNDGLSGILSEENFLKLFRSYSIRSVSVFMRDDTDFQSLKAAVERSVNDSYIQVDSSSDVQKSAAKQSAQFIMLIDCMIVVLALAGILMMVNAISMAIKNNQYSLSVMKLLGATNRNLVLQSGIEGIIYGTFSSVFGIIAGILLNLVLTSSMNKLTSFNLRPTLPAPLLIASGLGFLITALLSEMIATGLNYKVDYKSVLVQE